MPYPSHIDPAQIGPRALAVVEARGWDQWSLREVAGELGVSPNALYRYVDGRDGLVVAIGAAAAWARWSTSWPRVKTI
jgi:AcrR family transcriptional regulator